MKKKTNKTLTIIIALTLLISSAIVISYALPTTEPVDPPIVNDLATMSEMSNKDINKLYAALKDWDKLSENIMVYKQILNITVIDKNESEKAFEYIARYKADDLLSIYEFLSDNKLSIDRSEKILNNYDKTMDIDLYKAFDNYKPADKDQIRQWMSEGHTPDDILGADVIAMERDISIEDAMTIQAKEKSSTTKVKGLRTVKDIESQDVEVNKKAREFTISIGKGENAKKFTDVDHKKLIERMNQETKAPEDRDEKTDELTDEEREKLETKGLNKQEVKNIIRLSKQSGKGIDEILAYKESKKEWKEVIQKYGK